ncbi:MAG: hypothetical protein A2Y95_13130 [Deltaproteobacteria bacterium RBG_13_65_10]|nr:MAG: hypothetical protein A2Y95_13130 [Deltaproteobacteria bacterium RBG_13_65_10]
MVFPDARVRYSYAEFKAICDRFARGLMHLGLPPGANMALWCTNRPEWVVAQMGSGALWRRDGHGEPRVPPE